MYINRKNLELAMARKCMSIDNLSALTGISVYSLTKLKNGMQKGRTKTIGLIAKALEVDVTEIIVDLPKWFFPLKGFKEDFSSMAEGDGRNQALFNYILTLQSFDFTNEEIRETIKILNKYVLKKPLSDKELNTILRDEAFRKQSFFKGTKFLHDKFATYLKNDKHIIKLNGQLHIYQDGFYTQSRQAIEKAMVEQISSLKKTNRTEVLNQLELICESKSFSNANLIAFKNGVYNLADDNFCESNPSFIITNKIPWDYNPAAESELVDITLNKIACQNTESKKVQKQLDDYEIVNNNIKAFVEECKENDFEDDFRIFNEPTQDVYRHYEEFCFRNGTKSFSKIEFGRQLCKLLSLESIPSPRKIDGKKPRIYRKIDTDV
jgi:DNA-binding Xre family transcriptional regulator